MIKNIQSGMASKDEDVRLPTTVIPTKYTLHYDRVDLSRFYFTGSVHIDLNIKEVCFFLMFFTSHLGMFIDAQPSISFCCHMGTLHVGYIYNNFACS